MGQDTRVDAALARLTVVIPVGPDDCLAPALRAQLDERLPGVPVRVVCARADDARRTSAELRAGGRWDVRLSAPGRAVQQNAGAADATTAYLWFLHADSRLAADTLPALRDFLQREPWALGYFDLRFLDDGPVGMRLNALGAWVRSRWLGLPFGDQGFVLPRAAFEQLGCFDPQLAWGEDHELLWRARRAALPLQPLHATLYTSARKYAEHGWWRTTAKHLRESARQAWQFSRARAASS